MQSSIAVYILAAIGFFTLTNLLLSTVRLLRLYTLSRSALARYISASPTNPSWALVTGASDGIGRAFAFELCRRGANVLLHGRNAAKLEAVAAELTAAYPSRTVATAVVDAAKHDGASDTALAALVQQASNLPGGGRLRILVNNVGGAGALIGKGITHRLCDTSLAEVDVQINVNARFPARLTTALLPVLTSAESAPALVMNISSVAGEFALPYQVVYCATKAFNLGFSGALRAEMSIEGKDVEVLGLVVGSVNTPGAPRKVQNVSGVMEAGRFAREALDRVGCGRERISVGWMHWGQKVMMGVAPEAAIWKAMKQMWEGERKSK
jgi:17beta-estradiol 17-dehydrogenase / very-long-chain 3-oxoacyl-CoA reductase